jgi:hypothetical protein
MEISAKWRDTRSTFGLTGARDLLARPDVLRCNKFLRDLNIGRFSPGAPRRGGKFTITML